VKLTVVGYYSRDTPYEREAELLLASLERFDVDAFVASRPDAGSWDRNVGAKPFFIRRIRQFFAGPLLYVDVDAFVHEDPRPWLEPFVEDRVDFALHYFRGPAKGHDRAKVRETGWWPLTGTIFVADTIGARRILDRWCETNVDKRAAGDESGGGQRNLQEILPELERSPAYRIGRLPGALCYVYDKPWAYHADEPVVIEHTIASRENRDPSRSLPSLVRSRQARIRELRREIAREL